MTRTVMAMLLATMTSVHVSAESSVTLTVRLYNSSGIPTPQLLAARRTAESILRGTGMNIRFRQCGRRVLPNQPVDPCDEPLKPSEVVVRVIDAPAFNATVYSDVYGTSYVVKETNHGWLATVFSDRIARAATRVRVDPGTLLGRVMAHEVGHLLLGTGYHGQAGVMRADWPDALLNLDGEQWRFSTVEVTRMHRVLAAIAGAPLANEAAHRSTSDSFDPLSD